MRTTLVHGSTAAILAVAAFTVGASAAFADHPLPAHTSPLEAAHVTVYKSPTCGCCSGWVEHLERAGFVVDAVDTDDVESVKRANGLHRDDLKSCHTALFGDYLIEGHVPASDLERLLRERPDIAGLTAPGMPMMSPGMASETPKDYAVLAFDKDNATTVYSQY